MRSLLRPLASSLSSRVQEYPRLHAALKHVFLSLPPCLRGRQLIWDSLRSIAREGSPIFVIQIGANDGEQSDPLAYFIRKHKWRGLLVEPVPRIFERLKRNYDGHEGLAFLNAAIAEIDGVSPFYFIDDPEDHFPPWVSGLGSFDRRFVVSEAPSGFDLDAHLREIQVPCLSLSTLLERNRVDAVDILVVDTQGFDHKIVLQIPFSRIRPRIIIFEHILLRPEDARSCDDYLASNGYTLECDHWDVLATRRA